MNVKLFSLLILATAVTGCTTSRGFSRGELRDEMNGKVIVDDNKIKLALERKAQLPRPFKLGIYFQSPEGKNRWRTPAWHWTAEDKQKVFALTESLKAAGEVSDVINISDAVVTGTDLPDLRFAAAQHGADALLVVSGVGDIDSYNNGLGWTYVALVTALFMPASEVDALFMARASMWDVRNEFLYMTADAESVKHQTRPAAFTDHREALDIAKSETLDSLRGEIGKMIDALKKKQTAAM